MLRRRGLHLSSVDAGRPPLKTLAFSSANRSDAYSARWAAAAAARAFFDGERCDVGGLARLDGVLGVRAGFTGESGKLSFSGLRSDVRACVRLPLGVCGRDVPANSSEDTEGVRDDATLGMSSGRWEGLRKMSDTPVRGL